MFLKILETCIKVYELDPAHFLSARGLAWQACLKKTGVELELIADVDMLLMVVLLEAWMCMQLQLLKI